jgi:hypothetical protein
MGTFRFRAAAFLLVLAALPAAAQRVLFSAGDEAFTDEGLVNGVRASAQQCAKAPGAVWAQAQGVGECLRYWHAGLAPLANERVLVWFNGDLLARTTVLDPGYANLTPARIQAAVDANAARLDVPYVFLARPGTYGSSGEHQQRRRPLESRLISAALDEIKKRHGIRELVIAGQSGGGHVVASLLSYRSDVVCAVPTSSVSSPRIRWTIKGLPRDATGYDDSYEPVEHLVRMKMNPKLRVFVLGDPQDLNTPWKSQIVLAEKLASIGVPVEVLEGEGVGLERHGLSASGARIGSLCAREETTPRILENAAKGLKG